MSMDSPISVKRFLEQVKLHIEPRFANVCLVGEVSNLRASGRHWYFTLKEESATLSCAVWSSRQRFLRHLPRDGQRVIVIGNLNLYVPGGSLTLAVTQCEQAGQGDLQQKLRDIEAMLRAEGVFDRARLRPPRIPKKIAVIAALGGAALQDIIKVTRQRAPSIDIMVFPAAAQGDSFVMENLMALQEAQDARWACDLILMVRGGGSQEDLWGYNDPDLVRAVSKCALPIITGVGHEIDLTLVDLASDVRAATPSQAAELAVPDRAMLRMEMVRKREQLGICIDRYIGSHETTLNLLTDQILARLDPLETHCSRLEKLTTHLERVAPLRRMDGANMCLALARQRLQHAGHSSMFVAAPAKVASGIQRLDSAIEKSLELRLFKVELAAARLGGLDPESPLDKGFVLVSDQRGRALSSSIGIGPNAKLRLRWRDGYKWVVAE